MDQTALSMYRSDFRVKHGQLASENDPCFSNRWLNASTCLFSLIKCVAEMHEPYPKQALVFMCLQYKCFENTVEKGEIGQNQQFPLFKQCFLLILRTFHNFDEIQNYHLQILSGWKSLIFVILERVKPCFLRVWPHYILSATIQCYRICMQ